MKDMKMVYDNEYFRNVVPKRMQERKIWINFLKIDNEDYLSFIPVSPITMERVNINNPIDLGTLDDAINAAFDFGKRKFPIYSVVIVHKVYDQIYYLEPWTENGLIIVFNKKHKKHYVITYNHEKKLKGYKKKDLKKKITNPEFIYDHNWFKEI